MTAQPIGLSHNLAPRQVMRACVGQHDIAVWRSVSGVVSAWENRCPHRGMRLSHGFVRGESLACAYHGWHYNSAGFCHYIPAHPELNPPKTVRPVIFSVAEHAGLIWLDPNDSIPPESGQSQESEQPVKLPSDTTAVRSLTIDCDLDTAVDALTAIPKKPDPKKPAPYKAGLLQSSGATDTFGYSKVKVLSETPRVVTLDACGLDDGIIIAFQPLHDLQVQSSTSISDTPKAQRVIAHVLARNAVPTDHRIYISRWLEAVRRFAEKQ